MSQPPKKKRRLFSGAPSKLLSYSPNQSNQSAAKCVHHTVSFASLTTTSSFDDASLLIFIKRFALIPTKSESSPGNRIALGVVSSEGELFTISGGPRAAQTHRELQINKWYHLKGGKVNLYQDRKQLSINSNTVFIAIDKTEPPIVSFHSKDNIVQDFTVIKNLQSQYISQLYLGGFVEEIGDPKPIGTGCVVHVTVRDINGVALHVAFWNQQDRLLTKNFKKHDTIILCSWKRTFKPIFCITNSGMIFLNQQLPKPAVTNEIQCNLSVIDWETLRVKSRAISCIDLVKHGLRGIPPVTNTGYYYVRQIKVVSIDRLFSLKDCNGERLVPTYNGKVRDLSCVVRPFDPDKDQVSYSLKLGFQGIRKDITLFATGFEQAGKDLFEGREAKEMYQEMMSMKYEISNVVQEISGQTWNVFVTSYATKKDTLGYTARKIEQEIVPVNEIFN